MPRSSCAATLSSSAAAVPSLAGVPSSRPQIGLCEVEITKEEESKEWVKSINLPWKTQLEPRNKTEVIDSLKAGSGSGNPGWEFECKTFIGTTKDKCTTAKYNTFLYIEEKELRQEFPGIVDNANLNCSIGGDSEGNWFGKDVMVGPEGETLSFKT